MIEPVYTSWLPSRNAFDWRLRFKSTLGRSGFITTKIGDGVLCCLFFSLRVIKEDILTVVSPSRAEDKDRLAATCEVALSHAAANIASRIGGLLQRCEKDCAVLVNSDSMIAHANTEIRENFP